MITRNLFVVVSTVTSLLCLSLNTGCTNSESAGSVAGQVISDGESCGDCRIELVGVESRRSIGGAVDSSGHFNLENVPLGEYHIAVHQKSERHAAGEIQFDERIQKKYRNARTSGLSVSVLSTDPVTLNVELNSK